MAMEEPDFVVLEAYIRRAADTLGFKFVLSVNGTELE